MGANVDLETGKITGAIEGSRTYYHEQGHLKFEEISPWGNHIRVTQQLSLRFLLITIGLHVLFSHIILKILIIAFILASIYSELYEETWCWIYANAIIKRVTKEDDKKRAIFQTPQE